jgi:hypothetical protein
MRGGAILCGGQLELRGPKIAAPLLLWSTPKGALRLWVLLAQLRERLRLRSCKREVVVGGGAEEAAAVEELGGGAGLDSGRGALRETAGASSQQRRRDVRDGGHHTDMGAGAASMAGGGGGRRRLHGRQWAHRRGGASVCVRANRGGGW